MKNQNAWAGQSLFSTLGTGWHRSLRDSIYASHGQRLDLQLKVLSRTIQLSFLLKLFVFLPLLWQEPLQLIGLPGLFLLCDLALWSAVRLPIHLDILAYLFLLKDLLLTRGLLGLESPNTVLLFYAPLIIAFPFAFLVCTRKAALILCLLAIVLSGGALRYVPQLAFLPSPGTWWDLLVLTSGTLWLFGMGAYYATIYVEGKKRADQRLILEIQYMLNHRKMQKLTRDCGTTTQKIMQAIQVIEGEILALERSPGQPPPSNEESLQSLDHIMAHVQEVQTLTHSLVKWARESLSRDDPRPPESGRPPLS